MTIQRVVVIFCSVMVILVPIQSKGITVTNPDQDELWAKIGWNLGWAAGCNVVRYNDTQSIHRRIKELHKAAKISDREYRLYNRRRLESAASSNCSKAKVEELLEIFDRILVDKEKQ